MVRDVKVVNFPITFGISYWTILYYIIAITILIIYIIVDINRSIRIESDGKRSAYAVGQISKYI